MAYHDAVFSQTPKLVLRHEFSTLAEKHDGRRQSDAISRWTWFVYPGRFFGDGSDSLLLHEVWPDKGGKLGLVGFNSAGDINRQIDDDYLTIPELATIIVGDFIFGN